MLEISRFYGICVSMYFMDHNPPHVHVAYGEHEAVYDIATLSVISGSIPTRANNLFLEWARDHKDELQEIWDSQNFRKLPPLD